jgi:hypothetical protein
MSIPPVTNPILKMSLHITNSCICCDRDDTLQQVAIENPPTDKAEDKPKEDDKCCHCNIV